MTYSNLLAYNTNIICLNSTIDLNLTASRRSYLHLHLVQLKACLVRIVSRFSQCFPQLGIAPAHEAHLVLQVEGRVVVTQYVLGLDGLKIWKHTQTDLEHNCHDNRGSRYFNIRNKQTIC